MRRLGAAAIGCALLLTTATGSAVPALAAATPCVQDRPAGWVAAENARPGVTISGGTDGRTETVLGYLDVTSTVCGRSVGVHLGAVPGAARRQVSLYAYRIGWYAGRGARLVWHSTPVLALARPVPSGAKAPHLVTPVWPQTTSVPVTGDWPPGFYLLVPRDPGTGATAGPSIPLVVRHDGGAEPVLFQASYLTWNAYGQWGGWSLYEGPSGRTADRARVVAVHRPLVGSGYAQMSTMDLPAVRLLEMIAATSQAGSSQAGGSQAGSAVPLDVAYTTDVDVDARPFQLSTRSEVVVGGHSEYWSTAMYNGLLLAQTYHTNLTFLGANNLWWRTGLEGRTVAGEPENQVVYRSAAEDANHAVPTVLWQAASPARPPAAVLGQSHGAIGVIGGLQLVDAPAWFTAGTNLTNGQVLAAVVGNEADGYDPRSANPARTQIFAAGMLEGAGGPVLTTVIYSTSASESAVFAAGTTDWVCAAAGRCGARVVPARTAAAVATMTRNVVTALASDEEPTAGAAPNAPSGFSAASLGLRPAAIGRYTGGGAD